jgi:predicted dehydrogenase
MCTKVAIIGLGKMGRIRKKEIDAHAGFLLAAISDQNDAYRQDFPDVPFYTRWQDALLQDLDAVFVCTYNRIAPDIVCAALAKGCHVFCEKPPGCSVADVQRIIASERLSKGRVLKFGFNHRFHHAVMEAKAIVDSGRNGRPLWARGIYGKAGGLFFEQDWRSNKSLAGGGILLDQGIHMLDLMRFFLGDFVDIKSFVENLYWDKVPMEDNAFILMKTAQNQVAMVHSSANQWKHKFSLDIYMEGGYLSINGLITSTRSYGEESITFAKRQFEDEASAFGRPREETIFFDKDDSWRLECEEFFDCIVGKKSTSTAIPKTPSN